MAKFYDLDILMDYASKRQSRGIKRWCPNQIFFNNCRISAMLGDDLARDIIDDVPVSEEYLGQNVEDNINQCDNVMRTIWDYKTNEKVTVQLPLSRADDT